METEAFKQKLAERLWKIEGVMNELKNYHGLSKANYRGIDNVQIQAYMTAIAINIKRLVFFVFFPTYINGACLIGFNSAFTTGRRV